MALQDGNSKLIRQLVEEVERRSPLEQAPAIAEFVRQYYESFPVDELRGRSLSDLHASTYGSWRFLQYYDPGRPKVRVFNPEFERHGWQLGHTVVAILFRDLAFVLDSVRAELNRRNVTIFTIHAASLRLQRDADHRLQALLPRNGNGNDGVDVSAEVLLYLEINRHTNPEELTDLECSLDEILREVAEVVDDFVPMTACAREVREAVATAPVADPAVAAEIQAFIDWLLGNFFTFLGYEYLSVDYDDAAPRVTQHPGQSLGLLRRRGSFGQVELFDDIVTGGEQLLQHQLSFARSSVRSRVHRRIYPDYICIRLFDKARRVVAEHRFLGMFTSRTYTMEPEAIPVVRHKVAQVMARTGLPPESHEWAELIRVLETYPREELFHADADELFETAVGINRIQERRLVRLFARRDARAKFVSCLVFMPRDLYRTELRRRVQQILCDAFGAEEAEFTTFFSESVLTRTHFVLRVDPMRPRPFDVAALEREIVQAAMSWQDHLRNHLLEEFGEEQGLALAREYADAFPPGYRDDYEPRAAVNDIRKMATLHSERDIAMSFYRSIGDDEQTFRFRLFHLHQPLTLSDVMPILENLGLRVLGERPYGIRRRSGELCWIHEFGLNYTFAGDVEITEVAEIFQEAFARVWFGDAESDCFNKLILGSRLGWRDCALLRAYARYMRQIPFSFSSDYIADTLARHLPITQQLVALFRARFDPHCSGDDSQREIEEQTLQARINSALEVVENLSEDRIIRQYVALIGATLRTNYYQRDASGQLRSCFAFKLCSEQVPELPLPRPLYEVWVYSPRVEGIHLRTSKVARGGLRWSDRLEDFRTEVLGLVKAQTVKNSVIVPTGAKGGFVVRRPPASGGREALQDEGVACYRLFVQSLLDITDNRCLTSDGEAGVLPPPEVVRKDDDDPYLVVAADKGTAAFSDIANAIAAQYDFWLGDAFASGGSIGYDHKKMGITARGAWVSVQRHFRELGMDADQDAITVVGIGDMSGDVFGNGLLRSPHLRLVAAFNHQHIFIDPDPEAAAAFIERQRLFALPRSSWEDYDPQLISAGGGVFRRSAKSIAITAPMKARFALEADRLTPGELISALLRAPVDLLWNGGIGTYIKAHRQSHAECGDKANDALRVDANRLRCRVIGEGGNLGMTQLARVEYALTGGRCNTDFIDNAGGVDCSDHEVNIKIALNMLVAAGDMTEKQRRELLAQMTDSVAALVLANNARQTLAISLAERQAWERTGEYRRLIHRLEQSGRLNRALEFLPEDDTLLERKAAELALTRPELSVLISYTKGQLKRELLDPLVVDDPLLASALFTAFPDVLRQTYPRAIEQHRLRREIIATQVANDMVNLMGITFVERMVASTGATPAEVARAYVTAREVFDLHRYWQQVEALGSAIDSSLQLEMLLMLMRLVRRATRWFIRNRRVALDPQREVTQFRAPLAELYTVLPEILQGRVAEEYGGRRQSLREAGVPEPLAGYVASANALYPCIGIIDAALEIDAPPRKVAEVYVALQQQLDLDLFTRQIAELKVENHWQALARESFRDDLEWQLRRLTTGAMRYLCAEGDVAACVNRWSEQQHNLVQRWRSLMMELQGADTREFAVYAVAIRELLDLAQSSRLNEP